PDAILPAGDAPCILRGLSLRVVEVRRDSNDGLRDRRCKKPFSIAFKLAQDEGRNLRRSKRLVTKFDPKNFPRLEIFCQTKREQHPLFPDAVNTAPHQAFDRIDRSLGCLDQILSRRIAYDNLVVLIQSDY